MSSIQFPVRAVMTRSSPESTRSTARTPSAVGPQQLLNNPPSARTDFTCINHALRKLVNCGTLAAPPSSPPSRGSVCNNATAASINSTCGCTLVFLRRHSAHELCILIKSIAASIQPMATMVAIMSQYPSSSSGRALWLNASNRTRNLALALSFPSAKFAAFLRYHDTISSVPTPNPPPLVTKYPSKSSQTARDNATPASPALDSDTSSNASVTARENA